MTFKVDHTDTNMKFVLLINGISSSSSSTSNSSYCFKQNKPCAGWFVINKYFKDCLCNVNDEISFGLGIISLVCWGVAEIPQIITNFRTKSTHGVSLVFLLAWIAGDIFNLVGCLLEPATLPTQYYTAMLYTTSTVILVLQSLYYDHIFAWLKSGKADAPSLQVEEAKEPLKSTFIGSQIRAIRPTKSHRREYYFTSARSLAASSTPPNRDCLWTARSGPASAMAVDNDDSSEDESAAEIPKTASQPRPIPRSVGYGAFLGTSMYMPSHAKGLMQAYTYRNFLQDNSGSHASYGQWLGWLMAAIYMGGRIPQIVLNIKRGSVEGLNPLMFVFALVANATYVGSILVRSTEWEKIKANMPWLLDAAVCVALDAFIIMQYAYYRYFLKQAPNSDDDYHCDY